MNERSQLKELFYSTLLLENGYKAAKCDLGVFQKHFGIVSPTFNPSNFPSFTFDKIIAKYLKIEKYRNQRLFNLKRMNELLELEAQADGCIYTLEEQQKLLLSFCMQFLLGNSDLRE